MNQDQFHYHAVSNPNGYLQAAPGSQTWNSNSYSIVSNKQMYTAGSHTHSFTAPIPLPPEVEPEEEKPPRWSFKSF